MDTGSAAIALTAGKRNYECPPLGMTLRLCAQNGTRRLCADKIQNSSEEVRDYTLLAKSGQCSDDFIPCREFTSNQTNGISKRQANERKVVRVYVNIEGVEESNSFTLDSTSGDKSTPECMLGLTSIIIT